MLVPGQREGGVHDAPVPLQGNVPAENNHSEESSQLGADMYNDALIRRIKRSYIQRQLYYVAKILTKGQYKLHVCNTIVS